MLSISRKSLGPIALQEAPNFDTLNVPSFSAYGYHTGSVVLLWPSVLSHLPIQHFIDEYSVGVLTRDGLLLGSVYLPDSWKPVSLFVHVLERK